MGGGCGGTMGEHSKCHTGPGVKGIIGYKDSKRTRIIVDHYF